MTGPIGRPSSAPPEHDRTPAAPATGASKPSLRVIVADDHPLYRQGIVRALETAGEIVVAEAGDGATALELIRTHQPDVAIVDVSMPELDGIDLVGRLAREGPDVPVLLLSAFSDEPLVRAALQAGAAAYVTKAADRDEILAAVSRAAGPEHAPRVLLAARGGDTAGRDHIPHITRHEHDR
jgi:DNA-binding NarL/FixJ family response regulator